MAGGGVMTSLSPCVIGIVCKGISVMNYRKACGSGGTEFVIFLNKVALKCTG